MQGGSAHGVAASVVNGRAAEQTTPVLLNVGSTSCRQAALGSKQRQLSTANGAVPPAEGLLLV
jgi:hypothetical protein